MRSDHELLKSYVSSGDENAFAEIVQRHGDMVHAACRRQLRSTADDAVQAVFLLLSRKAPGLLGHRSLAGWLTSSTRLICLECIRKEARRSRKEKEVPAMSQDAGVDENTRGKIRERLDGLLGRLPEGYRDAVVLHYLEGRNREEVASELGLTPNAVSVRLNRAMEKMRAGLAGGGVAVSAAALGSLMGAELAAGAGGAGMVLGAMGSDGVAALSAGKAGALAKGAMSMMVWAKVKMVAAIVVVAAVTGGGGVVAINKMNAAETVTSAKTAAASADVKPALQADPAILAILKGLGDNSSALLPALKTHGVKNAELLKYRMDKNGPRPRDYCLKWVWSEDRKRALFCGANAGVPHRFNDVWEYDLASNTWVLLWDPDPDLNRVRHMKPEERKKLVESIGTVKDGVLMTKRGAPFDPVHTWWALTYDPGLKKMLWVMGHQNKAGYKYKKTLPHKHMRLWLFDPYKRSWEFNRAKPYPRVANASIMDYVPDLKGSLWYSAGNRQMQIFQSTDKSWKPVAGSKEFAAFGEYPGTEAVSAYDTKDKILVVHHGGGTHRGKPVTRKTFHYDVKTGKWTKVIDSVEGPYGYDNKAPMVYDPVAGRCFIVGKDALWSYKAGDKKWTKVMPQGPGLKSRRAFMACYNAQYNVIMADNGQGKVWVYRAKKR
jgi:RNA polymerase sigma factor (sigma-70 family)